MCMNEEWIFVIKIITFYLSWLFWTDSGTRTIERVGIDGKGREIIKDNLGQCVEALTIDFVTQHLFWVDNCNFRLESTHIGGGEIIEIQIQFSNIFTQGISTFGDYLFLTESTIIKSLNKTSGENLGTVSIHSGLIAGMEVVHPSKQPDGMQIDNNYIYCFGLFLLYHHMGLAKGSPMGLDPAWLRIYTNLIYQYAHPPIASTHGIHQYGIRATFDMVGIT